MPGWDSLLAELNNRLKHSQDIFMLESGGKSQCEVGRCRVPSLIVKKAEGSMHALIDLTRLISKTGNQENTEELLENIELLRQKWLSVSQLSEQWKAYRQSGLDEVEQVLGRLKK